MNTPQFSALLYLDSTDGLLETATQLCQHNVTILSAGHCAQFLTEHHIPHKDISAQHKQHLPFNVPAFFENKSNQQAIDLLITRLPRIDQRLKTTAITDLLAQMDLPIIKLIRYAAKYYEQTLLITNLEDIPPLLCKLTEQTPLKPAWYIQQAAKGLAALARYDGDIANALGTLNDELEPSDFPATLTLQWQKNISFAQGENAQQHAACYQTTQPEQTGLANFKQLNGRPVRYQQFKQLNRAVAISLSIDFPHVLSVHHGSAMSFFTDKSHPEALSALLKKERSKKQWLLINGDINEAMASEIVQSGSVQLVLARNYCLAALERFAPTPICVLSCQLPLFQTPYLSLQSINGGVLVQEGNYTNLEHCNEILKEQLALLPTAIQRDLAIAFAFTKVLSSHCCIIIKFGRVVAISEGQKQQGSAIDTCLELAKKRRISLKDSVLMLDSPIVNNAVLTPLKGMGIAALLCPNIKHPIVPADEDEQDQNNAALPPLFETKHTLYSQSF